MFLPRPCRCAIMVLPSMPSPVLIFLWIILPRHSLLPFLPRLQATPLFLPGHSPPATARQQRLLSARQCLRVSQARPAPPRQTVQRPLAAIQQTPLLTREPWCSELY